MIWSPYGMGMAVQQRHEHVKKVVPLLEHLIAKGMKNTLCGFADLEGSTEGHEGCIACNEEFNKILERDTELYGEVRGESTRPDSGTRGQSSTRAV